MLSFTIKKPAARELLTAGVKETDTLDVQ